MNMARVVRIEAISHVFYELLDADEAFGRGLLERTNDHVGDLAIAGTLGTC